ncbi:MAG TPA: hypothetical protein DEF51_48380 [Myxococcales bacterium]|nr:hypothetical protein [Myxococcales bacterium]
MKVEQGKSFATDGHQAVAEATQGWADEPEIIFVFASMKQDGQAVIDALRARFGEVPIAGCTTAGEHLAGAHSNKSLVAAAVYDSSMRWTTEVITDLKSFGEEDARGVTDALFASLGVERETLDASKYFSLLMIDGLSMAEERVSAQLAEALEGVPLAGGSAGDDLAFTETRVLTSAGALTNAAVVVLADKGDSDVRIVKHQHFTRTPEMLCITKADPASRTVFEMDGYPAIEAYARALGKTVDEVTGDVTFLNPVTFACNGELYVRSIQKVNEDGSITFYCAIEEGMVLDVGGHGDMHASLSSDLGALREELGKADFIVGFNCILRALEAKQAEAFDALGEVVGETAGAMIGFDTYGEQLNGLHINQTLVAVAIKAAA